MIIPWTHVEVRGASASEILGILVPLSVELGLVRDLLKLAAEYADGSRWALASEPGWLPSIRASPEAAQKENATPSDLGLWTRLRACMLADYEFPEWSFHSNDQGMLNLLGWFHHPLDDGEDYDEDMKSIRVIASQRGLPADACDAVQLLHKDASSGPDEQYAPPTSWLSLPEIDLDADPTLPWYDPADEPPSLDGFRQWVRELRRRQRSLSIRDSDIRIVYWMY